MKERPILFSAPMVRAILAGKKTVTRRIVNCPRDRTPYGVRGDRLWVRETWQAWKQTSYEYDEWEALTREVRGCTWAEYVAEYGQPSRIEYRATSKSVGPWTPAIHMPRWASRILLEVVSVRVERLHDITEEDARAEGVRASDAATVVGADGRINHVLSGTHFGAFACLWDDINGGRAAFASNPWVWRVEFKRLVRSAA